MAAEYDSSLKLLRAFQPLSAGTSTQYLILNNFSPQTTKSEQCTSNPQETSSSGTGTGKDNCYFFSWRNNVHLCKTPAQERDQLNNDDKKPEHNLAKNLNFLYDSQQDIKNLTHKIQESLKDQLEAVVHFIH